jgi:23S rRNA (uracil1939-C5)-methyltransferase
MNTYLQKEDWDIVLLDPPRTGAKMIIPSLNKVKADTIIYVSCDPVTMCRDIKELSLNGWEIQEVIGVDMFPQTPHIECLTVLKK